MALIKNIEERIKLVKTIAIGSMLLAITIVIATFYFAFINIAESRKSIYIIDRDVPILAKQTDQQANRPVEYKAHVDLFHSIYFTLTPDNKYIDYQMKRAMYLVDETGMLQYNNLKEKGYFNQILSSSAVLTLETDSISLDMKTRHFIYYGKQKIERKSSVIIRSLITEGKLNDVPRSSNNPHGVIIQNWKTLENKDISVSEKTNI